MLAAMSPSCRACGLTLLKVVWIDNFYKLCVGFVGTSPVPSKAGVAKGTTRYLVYLNKFILLAGSHPSRNSFFAKKQHVAIGMDRRSGVNSRLVSHPLLLSRSFASKHEAIPFMETVYKDIHKTGVGVLGVIYLDAMQYGRLLISRLS